MRRMTRCEEECNVCWSDDKAIIYSLNDSGEVDDEKEMDCNSLNISIQISAQICGHICSRLRLLIYTIKQNKTAPRRLNSKYSYTSYNFMPSTLCTLSA